MQLNEIHDPHEHASVSLKVILLVFAVILVGVLGYLVWDFNNTPDTTDYSSTVTKNTESTKTEETDETVNWKVYKNTDYSVSFRYPKSWSIDKEEKEKYDKLSPSFTGTYITFDTGVDEKAVENGSTYSVKAYVYLTNYDAYVESNTTSNNAALADLKKIFLDSKSTLSTGDFLPRTNWAVFASNIPTYVANMADTWRGYYFFSTAGQDFSQVVNAGFNLTDGKKNVMSYRSSLYSKKAVADPCTTQSCINTFYDYIKSIEPDDESEPIVKMFNDTIAKIIKSVETP